MKSLSRSMSGDPSFPTSSGWTQPMGPAVVDAVDSAVVRDDTE